MPITKFPQHSIVLGRPERSHKILSIATSFESFVLCDFITIIFNFVWQFQLLEISLSYMISSYYNWITWFERCSHINNWSLADQVNVQTGIFSLLMTLYIHFNDSHNLHIPISLSSILYSIQFLKINKLEHFVEFHNHFVYYMCVYVCM